MSGKDRRILEQFASAVRERFPQARIWAFGSRTTGQHTKESDLDVCIVVPGLTEAKDRAIMRIAWRVGFENDRVVSTVTYSQDEFERGPCSVSTLVQGVLHHGVPA